MAAEPGVLLEAVSVSRHEPFVAGMCVIFPTLGVSAADG